MRQLTCYVVPGLGATGELFSQVDLPPWINVCEIAWEPCKHGETIAQYSERLLPQIDHERPHIYLGYSFGACVAVEMALRTKPLLTVIVSGVAQRSEIPFYLRRARALGLYNLAPLIVRLWTPLLRWGAGFAFGTRDPAGIDLLVKMIRSIDPSFYECGLKSLMSWQNETVPKPLLHIHGARDLLLPARYVRPDLLIPKAGHFIIYTRGHQIGQIIARAARAELERSQLQ